MRNPRLYFYTLFALVLMLFLAPEVKAQLSEINKHGGFEDSLPSYWTMGKTTGGVLSWATDQAHSFGRSLKIVKTAATTDSVYWQSENMVDMWAPKILSNIDILLGAYVMTQNVNTNPASDSSAMWWISYTFWDSAGAKIGEVKLPIDQTNASSTGWVADTNGVGATILPRDAWKLVIKFVAGPKATGTVWADDFILAGRGTAYPGQDWNTGLLAPTGWNYWFPPNGGNDAKISNGFENTRLTDSVAHTGKRSLMFNIPVGTHDAWFGTRRVKLDSTIKGGDSLRISIWVKASHLVPDSANKFPGQWAVGFTPLFHSGWRNNDPYNEIGSKDTVFTFPAKDSSFDWTQYTLVYPVPTDTGAKAFSVRIHVYARFQGTVYFDDLTVNPSNAATAVETPKTVVNKYALEQNYPNPFNPTTTIRYSLAERTLVKVRIYDLLGREVRTLINTEQNAGNYSVLWNGLNNNGAQVATGTYIYRIEAGNFTQVKKMMLLK